MRLLSIVCILAASAVLSPCTAGEIPAVDIGTGALTCVAMTRTADGQLLVAGRMGGILVYAVGNADGSKWSVTKLAMPELLDQTADVYAFADWAHVPMVAGTWRRDLCHGSRTRIKVLQEQCALSIYGHDPDLWCALRHAPEYYD